MKQIVLHGKHAGGRVAQVDDEEFKRANALRWTAKLGRRGEVYAITNVPCTCCSRCTAWKTTSLHAFITGWERVDHKDHNTLNCQKYNLRKVTAQQSAWNTRSRVGATSGYKNVTFDESRTQSPWMVQLNIGGRKIRRVGRFKDEKTAALAADMAMVAIHGEYAVLNCPGEQLDPNSLLYDQIASRIRVIQSEICPTNQ